MYHFAIIGCGRIATRHAENISRVGKLVAVCDLDPEKAAAFARDYGVKAYSSVDEMLKAESEIEVVSICSPNGYHAEHSIKCLQAGKNVLCEKPLCLTSAAAWQIIETEKFSRKQLFVVKSVRFNPLLRKLRELVTANALGQVYSFQMHYFWNRPISYFNDWHGKLFPDGGTLYTQFSHYVDALLWLFGDIEQVRGFTSNLAHGTSLEFEDTGAVALQMKQGMLGTLNWSVNTFQKNYEIGLTIIAEKATIAIGGEYLNEVKSIISDGGISLEDEAAEDSTATVAKPSMSFHQQIYEELVQALGKKENGFPNAFDGLKTVEAIEKIYKAVQTPAS